MNARSYIILCLLLAASLSLQGCYEATGRRDTQPLKYNTGIELTQSQPDLIQSRLDSLIAFMIRNEIVEIQFKKNNLRFDVVMRRMKNESEINNVIFNKLLEDIELRNSTFYTSFEELNPETVTGLSTYENGLKNVKDDLVISIKATIDKKDDINN